MNEVNLTGTYLEDLQNNLEEAKLPEKLRKVIENFIRSHKPLIVRQSILIGKQNELIAPIEKEIEGSGWLAQQNIGHKMYNFKENYNDFVVATEDSFESLMNLFDEFIELYVDKNKDYEDMKTEYMKAKRGAL